MDRDTQIRDIAHDFNNILTAIMVNLSMVKMEIGENDPKFGLLSDAQKACAEGRDLMKQLEAVAKIESIASYSGGLSDLLRDAIDFALKDCMVQTKIAVEEDLWPIEFDHIQMIRVLNGLARSAKRRLPKGGILRVSVRNRDLSSDSAKDSQPEKYVQITFTDAGPGNLPSAETAEEVFAEEISEIASYVENMGGFLKQESPNESEGIVALHFPYRVADETSRSEPPAQTPVSGRILVMDDMELIRNSLERMLTGLGYEVALATNGDEAIAECARACAAQRKFDVALLDMAVPGGKGADEVVKALKKLDPELKTILASGYLDTSLPAAYAPPGYDAALGKPFRTAEVRDALKEVMRRSG